MRVSTLLSVVAVALATIAILFSLLHEADAVLNEFRLRVRTREDLLTESVRNITEDIGSLLKRMENYQKKIRVVQAPTDTRTTLSVEQVQSRIDSLNRQVDSWIAELLSSVQS